MRRNRLWAKCAVLAFGLLMVAQVGPGAGGSAHAQGGARVEFTLTDNPGTWFTNTAGPVGGNRSLGIISSGAEVKFGRDSRTVHTVTSLIFPTGAAGMPFGTKVGSASAALTLKTPGLYVFVCQVHPYMLGAVIVDDPATPELDLGRTITLENGITVPSASDLALRLLRTFFVATTPSNWRDYTVAKWDPVYPAVPVLAYDAAGNPVRIADLNAFMDGYFQETGGVVNTLSNPAVAGVGEVWVDTQFELTAGKDKPGTATAVDAATWKVTKKVALPKIGMNNPHNMWTDRDQKLIYQTEWFDSRLTVFDRATGRLVRTISVGDAPAHVMTRVDTDELHVTLNGATGNDSVVELTPGATSVKRRIDIGAPNPHAHWMGHDGKTMVTPNVLTKNSTTYDFGTNRVRGIVSVGSHPLAAGMTPDDSKAYVANFLDSTLSVIDVTGPRLLTTINLLAGYDPITGSAPMDPSGAPLIGGLPIQTPVSPDGRWVVTANTLTGTILIVDVATDKIVRSLPCDPGCHGVQFGAKLGGGYYAYVANKFSNALLVVDPDADGDGSAADAAVVGKILLTEGNRAGTYSADDTVVGNPGMGGQGILPIPLVYNGWVQKLPQAWKANLTPAQLNPAP